MSILADFFVSTPEQAMLYASSIEAHRALKATLQPFETNGLTPLELGTLWAILAGTEYDAKKHALEEVRWGERNESWLFRLPDELVGFLAGMNQHALESASDAWSQSEELQCSPRDVQPALTTLRDLADRQTRVDGQSLYLWGSV